MLISESKAAAMYIAWAKSSSRAYFRIIVVDLRTSGRRPRGAPSNRR
jgi:hypothetical protein